MVLPLLVRVLPTEQTLLVGRWVLCGQYSRRSHPLPPRSHYQQCAALLGTLAQPLLVGQKVPPIADPPALSPVFVALHAPSTRRELYRNDRNICLACCCELPRKFFWIAVQIMADEDPIASALLFFLGKEPGPEVVGIPDKCVIAAVNQPFLNLIIGNFFVVDLCTFEEAIEIFDLVFKAFRFSHLSVFPLTVLDSSTVSALQTIEVEQGVTE